MEDQEGRECLMAPHIQNHAQNLSRILSLTRRARKRVGLSPQGARQFNSFGLSPMKPVIPKKPRAKSRPRDFALSFLTPGAGVTPAQGGAEPTAGSALNQVYFIPHHTAASRSTAFSTFARRSSPVFANDENCSAVVVIPERA